MSRLQIIDHDDPRHRWDEREFHTYDGEPFTGIVEEFMNGRRVSQVSVRDGLAHGFYLYFHANGRPSELGWNGSRSVDGVRIQWRDDGKIENVEKRWSGQLVQTLSQPDTKREITDVMTEADQRKFLESPIAFTRYARTEPVDELYDQAMNLFRNGQLFSANSRTEGPDLA